MVTFLFANVLNLLVAFVILGIIRRYWRANLRVRRLLKDDSFWVRRGDSPCQKSTKASIIIPARDEEDHIKECVEHALAQSHENIEVIVLNDNSTDNTLKILQQFDDSRLIIVNGAEEPPEGWRGKPWACQRASKQASGEWLMFIDADVRIAPEAVAATIGYCQQQHVQYLTGLDKHVLGSFSERALHAYFIFDMGFQRDWYAINDPDSAQCVGNGRFMVFNRETFNELRGFETVANKIIEDEALGKLVKEKGVSFRAMGLVDVVSVRMYSSNSEVLHGWFKTISGALIDGNEGKPLSWLKACLISGLIILKYCLWDAFIYITSLFALIGLLPLWILPLSLGGMVMVHSNRWLFARVLGLNPVVDQLFLLPGLLMLLPTYLFAVYKAAKGTASWKGRKLA